jgi:sigma-E factor negative regulatory protein RseC
MLETRATVLRVEGSDAFVQSSTSGCSNCQGKGCSTAKLSKLFSNCEREFRARNPIAAQPGEEVVIGVRDGAVWQGIVRVYLWPLALFFVGAWLGGHLSSSLVQADIYAAIGAVTGLLAGFVWARWRSRFHASEDGQPQVLRLWRNED